MKFSLPESKKIILYLGRINKIKGIDFLIKGYSYLKKNDKYKDALLVIVGPDDGYLAEVRTMISSQGLRDKVALVGPLYGRAKLEAYIDAEVFVLPSRYEAFPTTVLEAYGCSKPIIASRIDSLHGIVIHGVTGFHFEKGDARELAYYLGYAMDNPADIRKMGFEGRRLLERQFSIKVVVDKLELLYKEVVENRREEIPSAKEVEHLQDTDRV
jgi:glycosyltransferase involved in cell wall biosynthesis